MDGSFFYQSPIGILKITQSGDAIAGICFVQGDDSRGQDFYSPGSFKPTTVLMEDCKQKLDRYFSGDLFEFDLRLLQPGTAFRQSVWNELVKIRYGKTESYLSLSRKLGNVKAIRAVGTANGKNNIAIVVPCHRVIGSNGSLIGYAGELWRKKWLLDHEAKYASGVQTLF